MHAAWTAEPSQHPGSSRPMSLLCSYLRLLCKRVLFLTYNIFHMYLHIILYCVYILDTGIDNMTSNVSYGEFTQDIYDMTENASYGKHFSESFATKL